MCISSFANWVTSQRTLSFVTSRHQVTFRHLFAPPTNIKTQIYLFLKNYFLFYLKGSKVKKIPYPTKNPFTWIFLLVSCPNYTYEVSVHGLLNYMNPSQNTFLLKDVHFSCIYFYDVFVLGRCGGAFQHKMHSCTKIKVF